MMARVFVALSTLAFVAAGPYDAYRYYYLVQYSDTACQNAMGVTFMVTPNLSMLSSLHRGPI